jgi:hypothetical protein
MTSPRLEHADGWNPPEEWACTRTTEMPTSPTWNPTEGAGGQPKVKFSAGANPMQVEVRLLAMESNINRLLRLKEAWGRLNNPDSWKDLDVEKTQWMMSAIFHMNQSVDSNKIAEEDAAGEPKKILALYETPGENAPEFS